MLIGVGCMHLMQMTGFFDLSEADDRFSAALVFGVIAWAQVYVDRYRLREGLYGKDDD